MVYWFVLVAIAFPKDKKINQLKDQGVFSPIIMRKGLDERPAYTCISGQPPYTQHGIFSLFYHKKEQILEE